MGARFRTLTSDALDGRFDAVAGATLNAIKRDAPRGAINQLNSRATELQDAGERFAVDDPTLGLAQAALAAYLLRSRRRINGISSEVQATGVQATLTLELPKALIGVPPGLAADVREAWTLPDAAALSDAVNYANGGDFDASLGRYQAGIAIIVGNIIRRARVNGWGPQRTAKTLITAVQALPAHYANSLLRSLQLNAYRDAAVMHQVANADILEGHIRIATLDDRTCAACLALHGTLLRIGERVHDHRAGRCTSIPQVKGRGHGIQTGPEWFNDLAPDKQAMLAPFRRTPAKLAALRAGAIGWDDFVQTGTDPIFGEIVTEASLSGMLGSAAQQFYL